MPTSHVAFRVHSRIYFFDGTLPRTTSWKLGIPPRQPLGRRGQMDYGVEARDNKLMSSLIVLPVFAGASIHLNVFIALLCACTTKCTSLVYRIAKFFVPVHPINLTYDNDNGPSHRCIRYMLILYYFNPSNGTSCNPFNKRSKVESLAVKFLHALSSDLTIREIQINMFLQL